MRRRATRAEMEARAEALVDIVSETRSKNWRGDSVELDAIHPDELRGIVRCHIEGHLSPEQFKVLKVRGWTM